MGGRDIYERFWQIVESGDIDRLGEVFHDDTEFTMPGVSFRGADGMRSVREQWWTAFPDLHHETVTLVESGDFIATEIVVTGTHDGPMLTPSGVLPATGRPVRMSSADVIRFRDGKIASWHAYPDMIGLLMQLGAMAPAPA